MQSCLESTLASHLGRKREDQFVDLLLRDFQMCCFQREFAQSNDRCSKVRRLTPLAESEAKVIAAIFLAQARVV